MSKILIRIFIALTLMISWTSCQDETTPEPEPTYCLPSQYTVEYVYNNQNESMIDVSFTFDEKDQLKKYVANRAIFTNDILNSVDITLDQNNQLAKEHFGVLTEDGENIEILRIFETLDDTTVVALRGVQLEGDTSSFFIAEMTIYTIDEEKYPKEAFLYLTNIAQSEATGRYVFEPYLKQIQDWEDGNLSSVDYLINEDDIIDGESARILSQRKNWLPNIPIETLKKQNLQYNRKELVQTLRNEDDDKMVSRIKRTFKYDSNPSSMQYATPMIFSMQAMFNPALIVSKNNITAIGEFPNGQSVTLNGTPSKNGLGYGTSTTYSYGSQPIYKITTALQCK